LYFDAFHHVAIVFSVPRVLNGGTGLIRRGFGVTVGVQVTLLLVTMAAAALLFLAGRAVARRAGGGPVARALHGLKVAPAYAVLALIFSFPATFDVAVHAGASPITSEVHVSPSHA